METFTVDGVVLKTSVTGEADRIVHVLTANRGLVRAFAKGARGPKSRLHANTEQFSYCAFTFSEKNGVFNVREAVQKASFFDLRTDLKKLTLSQYFCETLLRIVPEETAEPEFLRLSLNAFYLLANDKKPLPAVKAVFELRAAALAGYAPALICCDECGEYETAEMYFDLSAGKLYCSRCGNAAEALLLPLSVISAMRHIVFSPPERIFAFELSEPSLSILANVTERYAAGRFQYRSKTLPYYYAIP